MDHKVEELRAGGQVTSSIPPTPGPAPVPRPCRAPQAGQPPAALHSLKAPPPPDQPCTSPGKAQFLTPSLQKLSSSVCHPQQPIHRSWRG